MIVFIRQISVILLNLVINLMQKTKQLFKYSSIIYIILVIIIGLGTIIFTNTDITKSKYNTIYGSLDTPIGKSILDADTNFSLDEKNNISSTEVYAIDKSNEYYPSIKLAEKISDKLSLKLTDTDWNFFTDANNETILEYNEKIEKILLSFSLSPIDEILTDNQFYEKIAQAKLEELGMWPYKGSDYSVGYQYVIAFENNYFLIETSSGAKMIWVCFRQVKDDKPFLNDNINSGEIEVFMDSKGRILKINYAYRPIIIETWGTYPAINTQLAQQQIIAKNYQASYAFESNLGENINIDKVLIGYKIENAQNVIQPVYYFIGKDELDNPITLQTPVISAEYLKNPQ